MCGILLAIGPTASELSGAFAAALDTLSHRGPDGHGILESRNLILGHRRLSIIDLSDAASQPMVNDRGNAIVFNGEIYNYLELRKELVSLGCTFTTSSDTEVLLRSYETWGADCVRRFNGMWTFCIHDRVANRVFISRDRFGVKPLYVSRINDTLVFASEPKALIAIDPSLRAPNERKIARFLAMGELYAGLESFYKGIDVFPSGCHASVNLNSPLLRPERYWSVTLKEKGEAPIPQGEFSSLFEDSVRIRLRSDVPVGLSLSGGVDSSAILGAMGRQGSVAPTCFTATFEDPSFGEQHWAMVAASVFGAPVVPVEAAHADWISTLGDIAWHLDGPGYSPAVYPAWRIMREARSRGIPVLLEGQGADELMAGYPQYGAVALEGLIQRMRWSEVRPTFSNLGATFGNKAVLAWLLRRRFPSLFAAFRQAQSGAAILLPSLRHHLEDATPPLRGVEGYERASPLDKQLANDFFRDILPNLLQYGDAISMAHSIESRLPFMDYRIVEWAFNAGEEAKVARGITKPQLRRYLRSCGLGMIADRRDKQGYPTPAGDWLLRDGGSLVESILFAKSARIAEYCDLSEVKRILKSPKSFGQIRSHLGYKLLSLEMWLQQCARPAHRPQPAKPTESSPA